jgi:hypothetical protein
MKVQGALVAAVLSDSLLSLLKTPPRVAQRASVGVAAVLSPPLVSSLAIDREAHNEDHIFIPFCEADLAIPGRHPRRTGCPTSYYCIFRP